MFTTPIINLKGIPEAVASVRSRMRRLENFREPLSIVADDFFKLQRGWMDSEGRGSWVELKPGYARWKRNKVGNKPILQFSGALYEDMTGQGRSGVTIRAGSLTIRAARSGRRWLQHERGLSEGNKSGHPRPKRKVISPAVYVRKAHWNRLLTRWAAGENI